MSEVGKVGHSLKPSWIVIVVGPGENTGPGEEPKHETQKKKNKLTADVGNSQS